TYGGQQLRKGLFAGRITIGIYVLPQELNVGVARLGHATGFLEHRMGGTAALFTAGVRHDTEGAEFVAAFDDGDVSALRIAAGGELGLESLVGLAVIESGYSPVPCLELDKHLWQIAIGCRTAHQRDVGRPFKNFLAFLLSHTAQDAEL